MAVAGEQRQRLVIERVADEAVGNDRLVEPPDDQVDLVRAEQRQKLMHPALDDLDGGAGMGRVEASQHLRHQPGGGRWQHADDDGLEHAALDQDQVLADPVDFGEDAARPRDHRLAIAGQRHAPRQTVEDPDAEIFLEVEQAACRGRLGEPERPRCLEHAALVGDRDRDAQLPHAQALLEEGEAASGHAEPPYDASAVRGARERCSHDIPKAVYRHPINAVFFAISGRYDPGDIRVL